MGHKTDKKILCKRFQTSTLNSKMCLFVCKYLRLLSKTNLEFKRASKRSSQQASAWRDFRLFEFIYMLRKVVYLRIFCNGENWLMDKKNFFKQFKDVKYAYRQCNHQTTTKGSLAQHKRAVHEGVKYLSRQCNYQASQMGYLDRHKRAVHAGTNTLAAMPLLSS